MTIRLAGRGIGTVLMDVEGTTTPISFVTDVLFPYARTHLRAYLRAHSSESEVHDAVETLRAEHSREAPYSGAPPPTGDDESVVAYASWLMDRDSKSPGLKTLQGLIWRVGFDSGALHGEVFDDVPPALRRWRAAGVRTVIYSSGSVLAQRLLFGSTPHGDLNREIDAHFDTAVGPKRDPDSYRRIARALETQPGAVLFLSDVVAELRAARSVGYEVALTIRPGNSPQSASEDMDVVRTFDSIAAN